ncbi:hypothetical protein J4230_03510 [Candidatus Woesearchaeota archaeon]|nr:hypothetical protein [Candidatus Woesearchaeota archaeon]
MEINSKEKISTGTSIFSGIISFLGGYQVCHNVCLGIIALLSIIGITVVGMPLLFLQKFAIPFWIAAALLLGITLFFYFKKKCISSNMIIINLGIIIASIPFNFLQDYVKMFWIMGGIIVLVGISNIFMKKKKP